MTPNTKTDQTFRRLALICLGLFVLAFGIRFLVWQNNKVEMAGVQYMVTYMYQQDAKVLLSGDIGMFLTGPDPSSDATILLHPPGYPLFIAAVYGIFGETGAFYIIQMLLNSLAPVLAFLIALRLFELRTAVIAGILVAVAPQFAYHSSVFLPDELCVVPILAALYFFVRAVQDRTLWMAIFCGVSIGISCWFRSNAMLMPLFFAGASLVLFPKQVRTRFAFVLMASFIFTIAPITIRNYIVFKSFIPLSLGMGTTFVEGLGDCDTNGSFEMPNTDEGVMTMDAQVAGRPDYYGNLLEPDGVKRERERVKIGLSVVAKDPAWYVASVLHRGMTTFRMERVPAIAPERDERETTPSALYYLNVPLKFVQKAFITAVIMPLFLFGILLLLRGREERIKLGILAVIPVYYACIQSLIHTEYRYVLATPHILLILCAVVVSYLIGKMPRSASKDLEAVNGPGSE